MCDLNLSLRGSPVEPAVKQLYHELDAHDIRLHPHIWFSNEWFSPDGIPGIAVPFFLGHERLKRLEQKMMLDVEGGPHHECMRLLRHEAGHTLCAAYRLHYKPAWRKVFGLASEPYPDYYQPKPYSRRFVVHLDWWYAQAHPLEDFAETFAVWLNPRSRWRTQYRGWPAMRKLAFVNDLMKELAGVTPPVRSKRQLDPVRKLRISLREHYRQRKEKYADEWPDFYDRDLLRMFSADPRHARHESAAAFIRRVRPQVRQVVATWTSQWPYTIEQVLHDITDRCKELHLRRHRGERETLTDLTLMVTVQTMNWLHAGHHRIAL